MSVKISKENFRNLIGTVLNERLKIQLNELEDEKEQDPKKQADNVIGDVAKAAIESNTNASVVKGVTGNDRFKDALTKVMKDKKNTTSNLSTNSLTLEEAYLRSIIQEELTRTKSGLTVDVILKRLLETRGKMRSVSPNPELLTKIRATPDAGPGVRVTDKIMQQGGVPYGDEGEEPEDEERTPMTHEYAVEILQQIGRISANNDGVEDALQDIDLEIAECTRKHLDGSEEVREALRLLGWDEAREEYVRGVKEYEVTGVV